MRPLIARVAVAAVLGWASSAAAASHYVDSGASGAGTGASWADAWKTFASIDWTKIKPGDRLYISGGAVSKTYAEQLTVSASGASGQPITIEPGASAPSPAGHAGTVIIDAKGAQYGVTTGTSSYVTVKGLKLLNAATNGLRANGSYVVFENNTLEAIMGMGIHFNGCDHCVARRNRLTTVADDPAQTDGIVVYGGADGVVIEGNHLVLTNQGDNHNDCIQSNKSQNLTVRYNYCENSKDKEGYADAQGIYLTEMAGTNRIYGNVVYLKQGAVGIAARNLTVGTAKTEIINNTVKCGSYRCILVSEEADPIVKNNIAWQYRTAAGLYAIELADWAGDPANVDANLAFNQSSSGAKVNALNGSGRTFAEWQGLKLDAAGLVADPSLDGCYRADSASDPSVGAGKVLTGELSQGLSVEMCPSSASAWTESFGLVDRSVVGGPSWDIGAFERGSSSTADAGAPDGATSDAGPDGSAADGSAPDGSVSDASAGDGGGGTDAGPSDAGGAGTSESADDDSGCACTSGPGTGSRSHFLWIAALLLGLGLRRARGFKDQHTKIDRSRPWTCRAHGSCRKPPAASMWFRRGR